MNVDRILETFNRHQVDYLLIGGMNFLLRHQPVLTFDVDLWVADAPENLQRSETALADLQAEWGPTDKDWRPVVQVPPGWLERQAVFCMTSPHGPIDIFRAVRGLPDWSVAVKRAVPSQTAAGISYRGISDEDMLACQLALGENDRKLERVRFLRQVLNRNPNE